MNANAAVRLEAFESRFLGGRDPWSFARSPYERARYRVLLEALQKRTYLRAYEPGCAVGVLTRDLARMATEVTAIDFAPSAVAQARERCLDLPNVTFHCADLAQFFPTQPLDLIVFSEVGYYFEPDQLARIASALADCLMPGGEFVAVHWLGASADHVLHGSRVHEILGEVLPLRRIRSQIHPGFRLDSWRES